MPDNFFVTSALIDMLIHHKIYLTSSFCKFHSLIPLQKAMTMERTVKISYNSSPLYVPMNPEKFQGLKLLSFSAIVQHILFFSFLITVRMCVRVDSVISFLSTLLLYCRHSYALAPSRPFFLPRFLFSFFSSFLLFFFQPFLIYSVSSYLLTSLPWSVSFQVDMLLIDSCSLKNSV